MYNSNVNKNIGKYCSAHKSPNCFRLQIGKCSICHIIRESFYEDMNVCNICRKFNRTHELINDEKTFIRKHMQCNFEKCLMTGMYRKDNCLYCRRHASIGCYAGPKKCKSSNEICNKLAMFAEYSNNYGKFCKEHCPPDSARFELNMCEKCNEIRLGWM